MEPDKSLETLEEGNSAQKLPSYNHLKEDRVR